MQPVHADREDIGIIALEAESLLQAGKLDEALAMAGEVVRADIDRPEGFLLLGEVHLARMEHHEAAGAFERAVRKVDAEKPLRDESIETLATALSGRTKALMLTAQWDAAGACLRRLRQLAPGDQGLSQLLAEVELLGGRPQAAMALLHPEAGDSAAALLRGVVALMLEDREGAVQALRRAFLLDPALRTHLAACDDADEDAQAAAIDACLGAQLIERLDALFEDIPETLEFMVELAQLPEVEAEVRLIRELAGTAQCTQVRTDLLDAQRLAATTQLLLKGSGLAGA